MTRRPHYAWIILAVTFLALLAGARIRATPSVLIVPFALSGSQAGLWVFAVWYGLDWIATVPPTLRLATDAFGPERAPIMFG